MSLFYLQLNYSTDVMMHTDTKEHHASAALQRGSDLTGISDVDVDTFQSGCCSLSSGSVETTAEFRLCGRELQAVEAKS